MRPPLVRLIGKLFARPVSRRDRRRAARLGLESLEAREVPAVTFGIEKLRDATEGGDVAQFRVTATGDASDFSMPVYAIWDVTGGTATFTNDYTVSPARLSYLVFSSSGSTATVTLTATDDTDVEGDETVTVMVQRYQMYPMGPQSTTTLTIHDNDTPPPPSVSVARLADATENGAAGSFRFTRSGDTSQSLTVGYPIDDTDIDPLAIPGSDYLSLGSGGTPGSVTFAPGSATVDLTVAVNPDNKIEGAEEVRLTLQPSGGSPAAYTITGSSSATVTITDDPPSVGVTAEWINSGGTIGYIILTRSGGNTAEALTVSFDPEGYLVIDGETVSVVVAATASIPAGQTSLVVTMLGQVVGNVFSIQMQNAAPTAGRADQTATMEAFLNGALGAGTRLAAFLNNPQNLPRPLTFNEYMFLREVVKGDNGNLPVELFGSGDPDYDAALAAVLAILVDAKVDWNTVPGVIVGPQAGTIGAAVGVPAALPPADWQRTDARVQQLIADLDSPEWAKRVAASEALYTLLTRLVTSGDFGRYLMVYDRLLAAYANSTSFEQRARLQILISAFNQVNALDRYLLAKIREAAAVAGWVPLFAP